MAIDGTKDLQPAPGPKELGHEDLRYTVAESDLGFASTDQIQLDADWFGQERALAALELGFQVRHAGFNVYACGLSGTHRERDLAELLKRFTEGQPAPGDRVLVQNFHNPDRPRALYLPPGYGVRLRDDMKELVEELRQILPKTFRDETFEEEKEKIAERFGSQGEQINRQLAEHAEKAGFVLQPGPSGEILFIPIKDGRPMTPEEMEALSDREREQLRRRQREVGREVKAVLRQQQTLVRHLGREVKEAERRIAHDVVTPLIEELKQRYEQADVGRYFDDVRAHVLDNLSAFQEQGPRPPMMPFLPIAPVESDPLLSYAVNVLVDNGDAKGPPVIVEPWPTYKNLFGAVERMVDPHGRLVSNFTRVVAGSLLRAHGGAIVINLRDALSEPLVYRALKECLRTGQLEIEAYDPFALFATSTLKPEAMAIDVRVVLTGPDVFFEILYFVDDEFREIFKVRADFGFEAEGDPARRNFIAQVARIAKDEQLLPFRAAAVARLLEEAARSVGDRRKLPSQWGEMADTMREAVFWARKNGHDHVEGGDVEQAVAQRTFRLNRSEAKIRELIRDRTLLVDVDGERVGQVNGLAVLNQAGYQFGRPSRITAVVSMGTQGVIAVDREAKMSGKTFDKAVLIISAYLRHTYAQGFPLSLSASVTFEQSYSGIDGDSASAAELFAILSAIGRIPLRQDVAVTGSVNQFGEVQPVGGVNEKVEGFFYACREVGLTGRQGVILPVQNVDNLILAHDVVDAVAAGRFHLHPIRTLDEGLEILTGLKAGTIDEPATIHHRTLERLRELAESLRRFSAAGKDVEKTAAADAAGAESEDE
jgi:lon-related putative ATP-dependent protease